MIHLPAGKFRVLLIDDDADACLLFRSALLKSGLILDLVEVTDGFAAVNYLLGNQPYANRKRFPLPDLIFLDFKMPDIGGFRVLKVIRKELGLQNLPIVVLSDSTLEADRTAAYLNGASSFHKKPSRPQEMRSLLQGIIALWGYNPLSPSLRRATAA
jgi:CheY-like chemotaxis protein